jgi:hypothetical protein
MATTGNKDNNNSNDEGRVGCSYHDHSGMTTKEIDQEKRESVADAAENAISAPNLFARQVSAFPSTLHHLLTNHSREVDSIVSWQPHGRCFLVHDRKAFVEHVLPRYVAVAAV